MGRISKKQFDKLVADGTAEISPSSRQPAARLGGLTMPKVAKSTNPLSQGEILTPASLSVTIHAPIRIESEMNLREHWASRKRRYDLQEFQLKTVLNQVGFLPSALAELSPHHHGAIRVEFTRHGKRKLDDDNLQSGFKHVRDVVAAWIGVDDGDAAWSWNYGQRTGNDYRVTIRISTGAL